MSVHDAEPMSVHDAGPMSAHEAEPMSAHDAGDDPGPGRVLVMGVTSALTRAVAAELARAGRGLVVTARDPEELDAVAADLRIRYGGPVEALVLDALDFESHPALVDAVGGGGLEGVVLGFGSLADQAEAQADFDGTARPMLDLNYTAAISLLERLAPLLAARGRGFICAIGSVAGDRGRQSNYLYGSTKAGLAAYLQGLRNRLHRFGVTVTTVKPGWVDTRMTYGTRSGRWVADPGPVARSIHRAIRRGRSVVYVPGYWRLVMWGVRALPEPVFKRMKL